MDVTTWRPLAAAPRDRPVWVYAPACHGLDEIVCICAWHPDGWFCVDELREPELWADAECVSAASEAGHVPAVTDEVRRRATWLRLQTWLARYPDPVEARKRAGLAPLQGMRGADCGPEDPQMRGLLLPCPFCAAVPVSGGGFALGPGGEPHGGNLLCFACGARGPSVPAKPDWPDAARAAWNRRRG